MNKRTLRLGPLLAVAGAAALLGVIVTAAPGDPPQQVRLVGKGNKSRLCPIWPRTAKRRRNRNAETVVSADPMMVSGLFDRFHKRPNVCDARLLPLVMNPLRPA